MVEYETLLFAGYLTNGQNVELNGRSAELLSWRPVVGRRELAYYGKAAGG